MKRLSNYQIKRAARQGIKRAWKVKNNITCHDFNETRIAFRDLKMQRKVVAQCITSHKKHENSSRSYLDRKLETYRLYKKLALGI